MSRTQTNALFNFDTVIGVSGSGLVLLSVAALFLALPANSSIAATTTVSTKSLSKADTERARNYFIDSERDTPFSIKTIHPPFQRATTPTKV